MKNQVDFHAVGTHQRWTGILHFKSIPRVIRKHILTLHEIPKAFSIFAWKRCPHFLVLHTIHVRQNTQTGSRQLNLRFRVSPERDRNMSMLRAKIQEAFQHVEIKLLVQGGWSSASLPSLPNQSPSLRRHLLPLGFSAPLGNLLRPPHPKRISTVISQPPGKRWHHPAEQGQPRATLWQPGNRKVTKSPERKVSKRDQIKSDGAVKASPWDGGGQGLGVCFRSFLFLSWNV